LGGKRNNMFWNFNTFSASRGIQIRWSPELVRVMLLLILFCPFLHSKEISEIIIKGNINVKDKTILKQLKSKEEHLYSEENLKVDISNIMELGYFDDVSIEVDTGTWKITYTVAERPLIKKIELKGRKRIGKGSILGEISNKKNEHFDKSKLELDKTKIIGLYTDKGYAYAKVECEPIINEKENEAELIFFITEGKRVIVDRVSAEGTKAYKSKKILGLMSTKRKKIFKKSILEEDINKITDFYKTRGFEGVEISIPTINYSEDKSLVYVTLTISEGPKYRFGRISFGGNTIYSEPELRKEITIKPRKLYNQENLDESKQAIIDRYTDKGYLRAEINEVLERYPETGVIDIKFDIVENNIVYVDRIYIDGNIATKEFVIRREVLLKEDEPFSGKKLRRSLEKIYNLGFLDDVNVSMQEIGLIDRIDVLIVVAEGKPGMLSAGAGYSSVDGIVGTLQVSHMNLFGRAQRLNLLWEFGERRQNYQIGWTDPWFMQKPVSFGVSIYDLLRTREYSYSGIYVPNAYDEQRQGFDLRAGPRWTEYLSLLFTYSYEKYTVVRRDLDPIIFSSELREKGLSSSFTGQVIYDTRDYIFDASRGTKDSFALQIAGGPFGGDTNFYKPVARTSWFFPTFWKFVFSANANLGYVEGFWGYNLQPYDKFSVGGADTVRGYQYSELGPAEGGGRLMFVGNLEYKFPIVTEKKRTILQGAIFYDFGGSWNSFGDFKPTIGASDDWTSYYKWDNLMKSGFGFGIRFTTPAFPIRLDWGWAQQPRSGYDPLQFYFTLGQIF